MSDPLKLRVRNFLGIQRADVDFGGIVLAAGNNGAGKSSLCEAAACAVRASPLARGQTTKKTAADLLKLGTDKGSITLDYGVGGVRISYPECTVEQSGKPMALGTPLGIGATKLMLLSDAERARQISERFATQPTIDDLRAWSAERPEAGRRTEEQITTLWNDLDVQGWDAEHKASQERGTELKVRWKVVANREWGSKIASTWCPSPLLPGEVYDLAAARAAEKQAAARVEELLGYAAVSTADLGRLQELANGVGDLKNQLSQARKTGVLLAEQIEALVVARDAQDAPVDTSKLQSCPHCHGKIRVIFDKQERYPFLRAAPPALPASEMAAAKVAAEAVDEKIAALKRQAAENNAATLSLAIAIKEGEKAQQALVEARSKPRVAEEDVIDARQKAADWKLRADAVQAMQVAAGIYEEWLRQSALTEGLAPDGIRRTVMMRKMSELNGRLAELSAIAKFDKVSLTDELDCRYDGRPYALLSESERWRSDLVLTCLMAQQEQARLVIADRFDVLHPQARPGVLFLLRHLDIPALVCMTAKDRAAVPDLAEAGLGATHWLEQGTLV